MSVSANALTIGRSLLHVTIEMFGRRSGILMKMESPPRRVCWIFLGDRDEIGEIKARTWTRCLGSSEE